MHADGSSVGDVRAWTLKRQLDQSHAAIDHDATASGSADASDGEAALDAALDAYHRGDVASDSDEDVMDDQAIDIVVDNAGNAPSDRKRSNDLSKDATNAHPPSFSKVRMHQPNHTLCILLMAVKSPEWLQLCTSCCSVQKTIRCEPAH